MGEFGILLSTGVCAAMFSFRRTDNWLRRLLDRPRAFVTLASGALVIGFVPHLYTLAITIAYLLLAALFYPSVRVMSECKDTDTLSGWAKHPGMLSESYHENHHANLPHEAVVTKSISSSRSSGSSRLSRLPSFHQWQRVR